MNKPIYEIGLEVELLVEPQLKNTKTEPCKKGFVAAVNYYSEKSKDFYYVVETDKNGIYIVTEEQIKSIEKSIN